MHSEDFDKVVLKNHRYEGKTLIEKAKEYAEPTDRFRNFRNMAHFQARGNTPEAALWNAMTKHLEATMSAISKISEGQMQPMEFWNEKLGDIRIYSLLLLGMVEERIGKENAELVDAIEKPPAYIVDQFLNPHLSTAPKASLAEQDLDPVYSACHNVKMGEDLTICPKCKQPCEVIPF